MNTYLRVFSIFLLCLSMFISSNSVAQETILTYEEAIKIALDQNIQLNTEKNLLEVSQAEKLQSYGSFIPGVGASGGASRTEGQQFDNVSGQAFTQVGEFFNLGIGADWVVFNGMRRLHTLRQSEQLFDAQHNLVKRTQQEVLYNVTSQFLQILLDKKLLEIAEQNLKTQETQLEQIQGLLDAGLRPLPDLYTQQAEVKRAELATIQAKNELRTDRTLLSRTLLLDPMQEFVLETPDWDINNNLLENQKVADLYEIALENRTDLKQLLLTTEAAQKNISIAKSYLMPSLSIYYRYGSSYSSFQEESQDRNARDQFFTDNISSSLGLSLNIPIFSGFQRRTQIVRSKIDYENYNLQVKDMYRAIYNEVQTAFWDYETAKESYVVSEAQKTAADKAYEAQSERYRLGQGNLVELSQANRNQIEAVANFAQASYTLLFQKIILDYFTGTLNVDELSNYK